MPRLYKQLPKEDRDRLSLFKAQGRSLREIAGLIGRDVSTVSRELRRNAAPIYQGCYLAHKAQERADARKAAAHERERLRKPQLRAYVGRMLRRGWSPERISGRWKVLGREPISHEAIYQWVYAEARALIPCLVRAHRRRLRRGHSSRHKSSHIPSRTPISERPKAIELRKQPGHWEGDTIVSRQSRPALQVLVERKTRYTRLRKLPAKEAASMRASINRALARYPKHLRRSITYDNGSENTQHLQVNARLGTVSYFCEPMHSWEKGSVENAAGLVRRRLPKKTDFAMVSLDQVQRTERWINGLPRKCLGFKTSAEAFRQSVALTG
jgi:IS30 family transposase